jgi:hypothetical protein
MLKKWIIKIVDKRIKSYEDRLNVQHTLSDRQMADILEKAVSRVMLQMKYYNNEQTSRNIRDKINESISNTDVVEMVVSRVNKAQIKD